MLSTSLLDTSGAQAAGAEGHIPRGPLQQDAMTSDIELLAAFADVMGMADLMANSWTPSADLAPRWMCGWHFYPSDSGSLSNDS